MNTLREGRARAVAAFADLAVPAPALCATVGRPGVEDLDLQGLADLARLLTSLREGETTVAAEVPAPAGDAQHPPASRAARGTRTFPPSGRAL